MGDVIMKDLTLCVGSVLIGSEAPLPMALVSADICSGQSRELSTRKNCEGEQPLMAKQVRPVFCDPAKRSGASSRRPGLANRVESIYTLAQNSIRIDPSTVNGSPGAILLRGTPSIVLVPLKYSWSSTLLTLIWAVSLDPPSL